MAATRHLTEVVSRLPRADRLLLIVLVAVSLGALLLGLAVGLLTGLARAGIIVADPDAAYRMLTVHGVTIFFYWLYLAQAALLLAFAVTYTEGAHRLALAPVAWLGGILMTAGLTLSEIGAYFGEPLLYDGSPELVGESRREAGLFYGGYLLLAAGLFAIATAAIATALGPKFNGAVRGWSALSFGTVAWAGLVMVSSVAAANAFFPAALWAFDLGPAPADHSTGWHILFHNMHYLPLMGVVLIWYALVRELTGVASLLGERFSKCVFALYLVFVPPTSLYHMFLDPNLAEPIRVLGSLLSLLIGIPTIAVFLIITVSLESHLRARGARGLFGWLGRLPWRDPAMSAIGMAVLNLAFGGVFAFVLIQEKLAALLSDTFFVPGYFHFLTVGTVSLTLLGALSRLAPALVRGRLRAPGLLARLPYVVTAGVLVFGLAGTAAGLSGMPRRALELDELAKGSAAWQTLSTVIALGSAIMAAALAAYVGGLAVSMVRAAESAAPTASAAGEAPGSAAMQAAWTGPVSVAVLIGAMYAATALAFEVMRALPLLGPAGGGH